MIRVVHHIISECDIEVSKAGENIRIRFREKDENLVVPTDFELEGTHEAIHHLLSNGADVLERIASLQDGARPS